MSYFIGEDNMDIEIIYKPEERMKIFGHDFVKINKNNCKIIYKNKEYPLLENFNEIDENYNSKEEIKLKLRLNNYITNLSSMFENCPSLLSFPNIQKFKKIIGTIKENSSNKSNISFLSNTDENVINDFPETFFKKDNKISTIKDVDISNTSNMNIINDYQYECNPLSLLNTSYVTCMDKIFSGCKSLISLPDLSKWNTSNVTSMNNLFNKCESLISLPDISKWSISKVTDIWNIFNGCYSLKSLPDISKWDTSEVTDMGDIFGVVIL